MLGAVSCCPKNVPSLQGRFWALGISGGEGGGDTDEKTPPWKKNKPQETALRPRPPPHAVPPLFSKQPCSPSPPSPNTVLPPNHNSSTLFCSVLFCFTCSTFFYSRKKIVRGIMQDLRSPNLCRQSKLGSCPLSLLASKSTGDLEMNGHILRPRVLLFAAWLQTGGVLRHRNDKAKPVQPCL